MKTLNEKGFTVVELLVTIVIFVILTVMAVPSLSGMIRNNRITATANELSGLLQYAKTMAATRNEPVKVCLVTKGTDGNDSCSDFSDDDFSAEKIGVFTYKDGTLLRVMDLSKGVEIKNLTSGGGGNVIAFFSDSSAALHGFPKNYKIFDNATGALSEGVDLSDSDFPKSGDIKWQINANNGSAKDQCKFITVSALGEGAVTEGACES